MEIEPKSGEFMTRSRSSGKNYVIGPISYSGYLGSIIGLKGEIQRKTIHLFGESHQTSYDDEYTCHSKGISIDDFLLENVSEYLRNHPEEYIDLFLELPHLKNHSSVDSKISDIDEKFTGEFAGEFTGKSKVRIHRIDYRISESDDPLLKKLRRLILGHRLGESTYNYPEMKSLYENMSTWIETISDPTIHKKLLKLQKGLLDNDFYSFYNATPNKVCELCDPKDPYPVSPVSLSQRFCSRHFFDDYELPIPPEFFERLSQLKLFQTAQYAKDIEKLKLRQLIDRKIMKQFWKIEPDLREKLLDLLEKSLNNSRKYIDWNQHWAIIFSGKNSDLALDMAVCIMDSYFIGRLFSTFTDGSYPATSIFYGGDLHAKNYAKILNGLIGNGGEVGGFRLIQKIITDFPDDYCLDLRTFNLKLQYPILVINSSGLPREISREISREIPFGSSFYDSSTDDVIRAIETNKKIYDSIFIYPNPGKTLFEYEPDKFRKFINILLAGMTRDTKLHFFVSQENFVEFLKDKTDFKNLEDFLNLGFILVTPIAEQIIFQRKS